MIIKHVLTIHTFKKYTGRPNYYDKRTLLSIITFLDKP